MPNVLFAYSVPPVVGIGTQTVTDNFNRANEPTILSPWGNDSTGVGFEILGNLARPIGFNADDAYAIYTTWASGDNQYSQGEITATGTSAGAGSGVCVRHSTTATTRTMYRLVLDGGGNWELAKFITGTKTSLGTGSVSYVAATKLGLSINGTTLKVWYGGVQQGSDIVDSAISTGQPGIVYSSTVTSASIDNWDAGTT